jgi:hypothetical protein
MPLKGLKALPKKNRHQRRLDAKATRLMRRKLLRKAISAQIRAEQDAARAQINKAADDAMSQAYGGEEPTP